MKNVRYVLSELNSAIRYFGFIPMLITTLIGLPSILVIIDSIFIEFTLSVFFQWIVDGWSLINRLFVFILKPVTGSLISLLQYLGLNVRLHESWYSFFWLLMIPVVGLTRIMTIRFQEKNPDKKNLYRSDKITSFVVMAVIAGIPIFLAAFFAGVVSLSTDQYAQGLVSSALFFSACIVYTPVAFFASGLSKGGQYKSRIIHQCKYTLSYLLKCLTISLILFCTTIVLGSISGVKQAALFLCLLVVLSLSVIFMVIGIKERYKVRRMDESMKEHNYMRFLEIGLVCLGGFVSAFLVIVADHFLKHIVN